MKSSLQLFEKFGLTQTPIQYSEIANAFLSMGYTSQAGNVYFNSVRLAEGIIIKEDVGQGYAHTFLNGIKIYSIKDKTILVERDFDCCFYSSSFVKNTATNMLLEFLQSAANQMGYEFSEPQARAQISTLLAKAFEQDQREVLENQIKRYLA